jgi:preprotein translocase subunit SecG
VDFLEVALYVIHVLSCIILIVVVLLHEAKGDSLAAVFGGGGMDSAFGVQFGKRISRFTIAAAVAFMVIGIGLGIWTNKGIAPETIKSPQTSTQSGQTRSDKDAGADKSAAPAPGTENPEQTPPPAGGDETPSPAPKNK